MSAPAPLLLQEFDLGNNVEVTPDTYVSEYSYNHTNVTRNKETGRYTIEKKVSRYEFKTQRNVPKMGMMLVGLGGNNGTTVAAGILANKHGVSWETKKGTKQPNWYGSLTQASTVRVGNFEGREVFVPMNKLLPMVDPDNIVIGGWDISAMPLDEAMRRAEVLDRDLQDKIGPLMKSEIDPPLPSIFDPSFVAANQQSRATNVIQTTSKWEQMEIIRSHIREFKAKHGLDRIVVLWTANTERYAEVGPHNATAAALLKAIKDNHPEVSPSTLYAVACILESESSGIAVPFINGSPQNSFVPGLTELALATNDKPGCEGVMLGGNDFKSGQTRMKSVLVDFLIGAGIKPTSIVSYNHLGNNDGKNLSNEACFRSKEISKSDVVNDMVDAAKGVLYEEGEHPDHLVVIKYVPAVGDSKRAMDEYSSEIFMGGNNTIVMHNTCEDSLLAAPLILDLVLIAELTTRIEFRTLRSLSDTPPTTAEESDEKLEVGEWRRMHPINVLLSYLTKAPMVPDGSPCVNALARQRSQLENVLKACVGLPPESNMMMEFQ